jgi:hyaluronan synthase
MRKIATGLNTFYADIQTANENLHRSRRVIEELFCRLFDELRSDFAAKLYIIILLAIIVFGYLSKYEQIDYIISQVRSYHIGVVYLLACEIYLVMNLAAFLWRVILVVRYKPIESCSVDELLSCTVIVPAYNEGYQVLETLRSIVKSDYPAEKLQIIAVDDGSADDTWEWMETAANESRGRIETIKFSRNRGKKRALYEGFKASRSEVVVTIDSDSIVEKQTLRRLISPFVRDERVGAVAGNVRVLNHNEGLIPRMLDVSFAYSFDFFRASQSEVNAVFCTPGALSAYRREPLMKIADKWMEQTFCGVPAEIGEDRALTNWMLRTGQYVKFQSDAIVYTKVPVKHKGLCRMFLRWARSNVRETLVMNSFIFEKFRESGTLGARINYMLSAVNLIVPQILLMCLVGFILWQPGVFASQVLFGSMVAASASGIFYAVRHRSSNALWAYAYSIYWITALSWITPFALLTARNSKWLTRQIAQQPKPVRRTIRLNNSRVAA